MDPIGIVSVMRGILMAELRTCKYQPCGGTHARETFGTWPLFSCHPSPRQHHILF